MSLFLRVLIFLVPLVMAITGYTSLALRDWWLENLAVALAMLPLLIWRRRIPLSNTSYLLLFVFLCLHEYGSSYSYSNVPWGKQILFWAESSRNNYDRMVHFLFGLMLTLPLYEIVVRIANPLSPGQSRAKIRALESRPGDPSLWISLTIPVLIIKALSGLYEVAEWVVVELVSPQLGVEFLGAQGDPFDAQKDMGLAFVGSLIAVCAIAIGKRIMRPKSSREPRSNTNPAR